MVAKSSNADIRLRAPSDVGALIRDRRRQLGLDQAALAERVGVSRQWLIAVEQGKPRAALGLVLRTLDALGVRLTAKVAPDSRARSNVADIDAIVRDARKRQR